MSEGGAASLDDDVLALFRRQRAPALFVTELAHGLRAPAESDALAGALARLAARGAILIAEHPVPDPHLAQVDLRIVAPVPGDRPRAEGEAAAADAAETVWSKWLATFLASHRCQ